MNVLVSNDDGIRAMGIQVLVQALAATEGVNVYVCAPDSQRSACGHGISMGSPVMVYDREVTGAEKSWSISGTPADCVKLGIKMLKRDYNIDIDVVFSGINHGGNLGTDVLYSGTVSAALEGLLCGVPAVAVSVNSHQPSEEILDNCRDIISDVCLRAVPHLDRRTALNINFPNIPKSELKGLRVTRLGPREYNEQFDILKNQRGQKYYWYSGEVVVYSGLPDDLDVMSIQDGYVSITPIHFDLTKYELLDDVKRWNLKY